LSPKSDFQVKRTARVLLEMHRPADAGSLSHRSGIPASVLAGICRRYETEGLQQVLMAGACAELPLPGSSKRLALSAEERAFCRKIVSEQLGSAGRRRRAHALLLLEEGGAKSETAQASGVCERTLERLMERYEAHGVQVAVNDAVRSGRPMRYSREEFVPLIRWIVQQTRPETLLKWTMNDLKETLMRHRREAAGISSPTLRALVRLAGVDIRHLAVR